MGKKKKKPAGEIVAVKGYTRKFRPERAPPRDNKGRWRSKGKRRGPSAQGTFF